MFHFQKIIFCNYVERWSLSVIREKFLHCTLLQGCTYPRYQVVWVAKFCMVVLFACINGFSVWKFLHATFLTSIIVKLPIDFGKICAPLLYFIAIYLCWLSKDVLRNGTLLCRLGIWKLRGLRRGVQRDRYPACRREDMTLLLNRLEMQRRRGKLLNSMWINVNQEITLNKIT
jgi:hypothetical protein